MLKANISANRIARLSSLQYKVSDSTKIGYLKTKGFISAIETKIKLTKYLSKKLEEVLILDFVIVYSSWSLTNILPINHELCDCNQEKADAWIVLHALVVSKNNPFSYCLLGCRCTFYFVKLFSHHKHNLRGVHKSVTPQIIKTLIGFYAFSGCDQMGRFYGYSKNHVH